MVIPIVLDHPGPRSACARRGPRWRWTRRCSGPRPWPGAYFRTLDANEGGVVADLDVEFLHDFRVATRSSRSVLNRMREVFPEREHEKARSDLAWLGKITGPKRDLDVFLGDLDGHTARLPSLWRPHLDPLRAPKHGASDR